MRGRKKGIGEREKAKHGITNVVLSAQLNMPPDKRQLDLDEIAATLPNIEFEPDIFAGARLKLDGVSLIVFRTGAITITGARSKSEADNVLDKLARLLRDNGLMFFEEEPFFRSEVTNIVATASVGFPVSLEELSQKCEGVRYDPTEFPAAIFRRNNCTILVFGTGKITIAGATSTEQIRETKAAVIEEIEQYRIVEGSELDEREM